MFRRLIAALLAFTVALAAITKPAYAFSLSSSFSSSFSSDSTSITDSFNNSTIADTTKHIAATVTKGFVETAGVAIGAGTACYLLDGIATLFFPPAAMAAAFCPAVGSAGAVIGGTKAVAGL